jgi:hypothetical protein
MPANRRQLVLGAVLVIAVVAGLVAWSGGDDPVPPPRTRAAPPDRNAVTTDAAAPADVDLEALSRPRGEPLDSGRNLFRFRARPAPPPPSPPPQTRTPEALAQEQAPMNLPPAPVGPPPPPPITLKFIGIVEKADGTRYAVLTDGKRPISGREGQEIEGRYKILRIGNESLEIAYIDGRGQTTLRLSGQ